MIKLDSAKQEVQRILLQYMSAIHAELIHSHDDVFLANKIIEACEKQAEIQHLKEMIEWIEKEDKSPQIPRYITPEWADSEPDKAYMVIPWKAFLALKDRLQEVKK